jgi:hypothetical protein
MLARDRIEAAHSVNKLLQRLLGKPSTDRSSGRLDQPPALADRQEAPVASAPRFVALNELEALLIIASANPGRRSEFQQVMLKSDLLAATPDALDDSGWRTLETSEHISLLNVLDPDGRPTAAVFTSEQRIVDAFGAGTGFVQMNGATLLDIVAGSGAYLNPGSAYSVHWTADQLSSVLGRPVGFTVQEDTEIMLGVPRERPEALLTALGRSLSAESRIREAWLALAHWPGQDERSWYLDVRTTMAADEVSAMLGEAFQFAGETGLALNMTVTNDVESEGSGIRLIPTSTH